MFFGNNRNYVKKMNNIILLFLIINNNTSVCFIGTMYSVTCFIGPMYFNKLKASEYINFRKNPDDNPAKKCVIKNSELNIQISNTPFAGLEKQLEMYPRYLRSVEIEREMFGKYPGRYYYFSNQYIREFLKTIQKGDFALAAYFAAMFSQYDRDESSKQLTTAYEGRLEYFGGTFEIKYNPFYSTHDVIFDNNEKIYSYKKHVTVTINKGSVNIDSETVEFDDCDKVFGDGIFGFTVYFLSIYCSESEMYEIPKDILSDSLDFSGRQFYSSAKNYVVSINTKDGPKNFCFVDTLLYYH